MSEKMNNEEYSFEACFHCCDRILGCLDQTAFKQIVFDGNNFAYFPQRAHPGLPACWACLPWFTKLCIWDWGPTGMGLQAWAYPPGLLCPFQTHTATEASNVKGPVYSGNPGRKGVNKNKKKQIHALNSLEGKREGSERGRREWEGSKEGGEGGMRKRQAGTGNDLESQINKNKETVTSIKRQNGKWSIKIRSMKEKRQH